MKDMYHPRLNKNWLCSSCNQNGRLLIAEINSTYFLNAKLPHEFFPLPFCLFLNSNIIVIMFINLHNNYCVTFRRLNNGKNLNWFSYPKQCTHADHCTIEWFICLSSIPLILLILFFFRSAISLQSFGRWTSFFKPQEPTRSKEISQEIYFSLLLLCLNLSTRCVFFIFLLCSLLSSIACHFPISKALTNIIFVVLFWSKKKKTQQSRTTRKGIKQSKHKFF